MRVLVTGGAGFVGANLCVSLAARHPDWERHRTRQPPPARLGAQPRRVCGRRASGSCTATSAEREDIAAAGAFDALIECSAEPSVLAGLDGRPRLPRAARTWSGAFNCLEPAAASARSSSSSRRAASTRSRRCERLALRRDGDAVRARRRAGARRASRPPASARSSRSRARAPSTAARSSRRSCWSRSTSSRSGCAPSSTAAACSPARGRWARSTRASFAFWMLAHHFGRPLTYIGFGGTGKQVRDLLHVDDLVDLVEEQLREPERWQGAVFNVGGGPERSLSLLELTGALPRALRPGGRDRRLSRDSARATCQSTSRIAPRLFAHTDLAAAALVAPECSRTSRRGPRSTAARCGEALE